MALLAGDNSGKWSRFGDEVHEALAKLDPTGLTLDQEETYDMCLAQANDILTEWLLTGELVHVFRDSFRLGLTSIGGVVQVTEETTVELVNTGLADIIAIKVIDGRCEFCIIDYKTLRGDVKDASDNDQLRGLAVKVAKKWSCKAGRVSIVQPWVGPPTIADYNEDSLRAASEWLRMVLHDEFKASPEDRKAGDWCHYCPANAACEMFRNKVQAPIVTMTQSLPANPETARAALFARAIELPADTLAGLVKGLKMVGWYESAIKGAAMARAADDAEFQQWFRLKPGVVRESITDVGKVWAKVEALGVTADEFTAACSLTKKSLETMVKKATGMKGKSLDNQCVAVLEGATESKRTAEQLEEVEL